MTIGRLVIARKASCGSQLLLEHEAVHVQQFRKLGIAGFFVKYVGQYLGFRSRHYSHWAAYRRISFEVEAEWKSRRWEAGAQSSCRSPS